MKNIKLSMTKKTIGVVYDVAKKLDDPNHFVLPDDAHSEWESQETIDIISKTWRALGINVVLFPIDENFFQNWSEKFKQCDVIHSLVEGFGSIGRESWIASLCELSGIPCIGSSPFVHALCMDKFQVKLVCKFLNILTADSYLIREKQDLIQIPESFFAISHFIKPNSEGSGMGVDCSHSISSSKKTTYATVELLLNSYPHGILLETYLPGDEFTTGIIGVDKQFLPIAKIEVPNGVYGASNKDKNYLSEKVTFPILSQKTSLALQTGSQSLFQYLQMADMARFDWKCDAQGTPYFLEVNTLPGLSKIYSTLPLMAEENGIKYEEFFTVLFESAYKRKNDRSLWYGHSRVKNSVNKISYI